MYLNLSEKEKKELQLVSGNCQIWRPSDMCHCLQEKKAIDTLWSTVAIINCYKAVSPPQSFWGGAQSLGICSRVFWTYENHLSYMWQLRQGWKVKGHLWARGAEDKEMQENIGKRSLGILPRPDLGEVRTVPNMNLFSLHQSWPGHPMQEKWPSSIIGPPAGDHRDESPKVFQRKGVLRAMASFYFQAKTPSWLRILAPRVDGNIASGVHACQASRTPG